MVSTPLLPFHCLLPVAAAAAALAAQDIPDVPAALQQRIDRALAELADVERAADASAFLERLGAPAVPALLALLERRGKNAADQGARVAALYVVGRLGEDALPCLTAVRELSEQDAAMAVRRQAIWALGALTIASRDADEYAVTLEVLQRHWHWFADRATRSLRARLLLGPEPDDDTLQRALDSRQADTVAGACAALLERSGPLAEPFERTLHQRLQAVASPAALPWQVQDWQLYLAGTIAGLLAERGDRGEDPLVLRGMLQHWDPDRRRIALVRLRDHDLPPLERLDVVARLWDRDRTVHDCAVQTLAAWGGDALPALAALRALQRYEAMPELAARCGQAADTIVVAAAPPTAAGRAMLAHVDGLLRQHAASGGAAEQVAEPPPPPAIADDAARRVLTEVAVGCHRVAPGAAVALLRLGADAGLRERAAMLAMLRCLASTGPQLHDGISAFAQFGRPAFAALDDPLRDLAHAISQAQGTLPLGATLECVAWLEAGRDATLEQLEGCLGEQRPRRTLRALTELVQRGEQARPAVRKWLGEHLRTQHFGALHLPSPTRDIRGGYIYGTLDVDLAIAIGLVAARLGLAGWDQPGRLRVIGREFGVPDDQVAAWSRAATPAELATRLQQVEERARGKLDARAIAIPPR